MRRRARLVSDRRRLRSSRRRRARPDGRVGSLGSAEAAPSRSRCSSRSKAMSRLRACDRVSSTATRRSGPYRSTSLRRVSGGIDPASARSITASTLVLERLACCPPGPPEGLNRQVTSEADTLPPEKVSTRSTRRNLPPSPDRPPERRVGPVSERRSDSHRRCQSRQPESWDHRRQTRRKAGQPDVRQRPPLQRHVVARSGSSASDRTKATCSSWLSRSSNNRRLSPLSTVDSPYLRSITSSTSSMFQAWLLSSGWTLVS